MTLIALIVVAVMAVPIVVAVALGTMVLDWTIGDGGV